MAIKDRMLRSDPIWRRLVRRAFAPLTNKGFVMVQAVAGGAAGNHTVSKIKKGDHLVCVIAAQNHATTLGAGDLTSEFTVTADGVINNTGGTATTDMRLHVIWEAFDDD
jgi:hypothetical protein